MATLKFGDVEVTRLVEAGPIDFAPMSVILPGHDPAVVEKNRDWLEPDQVNFEEGNWRACVQTYVLRSAGRTILVDTGLGNHKERPHFPIATHLDTDFLDRLAAAGFGPDDVDVVVATHLHVDHVGWNTYLDDREWVPTFPNATYLFHRADVDYWNPVAPGFAPTPHGRLTNQNVYEDSVTPILDAGLATVWDGDSYRLDENLLIEAAPGHTPGSTVLTLESEGDRALFVGDLMHSPVQAVATDTASCFDEDPARAADTRRRIVGRAAETSSLLIASHFVGGEALEITREGDDFVFAGWTPFAE
jgi:glyoxylase-like metal-dependent hydrolase (beta-lactamase superfamily II)